MKNKPHTNTPCTTSTLTNAFEPGRMDLKIIQVAPTSLLSHPRNARTHSRKQIRELRKSLRKFGFLNPVLTGSDHVIIAGHARVQAAVEEGLPTIPCVRVDHLSKDEIRAYMLADNKHAENAGWDQELLAQELSDLNLTMPDLEFDAIGFSIAEVDSLIAGLAPVEDGDPADDRLPKVPKGPPRTQPGDIWALGSHRLICGDSRDHYIVAALMNGERAQMVFTDPPYNVEIADNVGGLGKIQHAEFAMASGEMTVHEFIEFLRQIFQVLVAFSVDGSIHFICMDWRHMLEVLTAAEGLYTELKNTMIWVKDNGGMGTFYRSRHEMIFAYKNGTAPHINTFELGQHGRYRTNVWEYRGVNTLKRDRMDELALHPTVKPVQMIADAIKDVSSRGGLVLDLFGGSGSTLIAANKTGRRAYLCEIDPVYCDRTIARWEKHAKDEAVLIACGWPRSHSTGTERPQQGAELRKKSKKPRKHSDPTTRTSPARKAGG
jgi:DNA modification methylase